MRRQQTELQLHSEVEKLQEDPRCTVFLFVFGAEIMRACIIFSIIMCTVYICQANTISNGSFGQMCNIDCIYIRS